MSTCPFCSEEIAADAAQCPSCDMELPGPSPANVGDAPPVQSPKSNAKKWILIGGAGCGLCLLVLVCLAALLLPVLGRARDAAQRQAAARNEPFPDSDEQLMEMETVSSEDDSGSGGGPVPLPPATTMPLAEKAPGSKPKLDEPSAQAVDADPVATLENLGVEIKRNEQGEVVTVNFDTPLVAFVNREATTDTVLVHLKGLTNLQDLNLPSQITDAGLVHLKGMTGLQTLYLRGTKVTDAGVADLQKALPNCKIEK